MHWVAATHNQCRSGGVRSRSRPRLAKHEEPAGEDSEARAMRLVFAEIERSGLDCLVGGTQCLKFAKQSAERLERRVRRIRRRAA
jgi:hypothetical protein